MKAVHFSNGTFHDIAVSWWEHFHPGVVIDPARILSKNGIVVIDEDKHRYLALQFLYPAEGSEICWIGFTVRNPTISHYLAGKALRLLIPKAEEVARQLGKSVLYTNFDVPALQKLMAKQGYSGGTTHKEYWRVLWEKPVEQQQQV